MRRLPFLGFAAVALFASVASAAWVQQAEIRVKTHGHEFHKVRVESTDCSVRYRLYFTAPAEAYPEGQYRHYQFRARVRFQSGKSFVSPVFGNPGSGERVYERSYDTTSEGCWAQSEQKLQALDVEACRGRGCEPAQFQ